MGFSQIRVDPYADARGEPEQKFDYCVLLSGSDYPIKSNMLIKKLFKREQGIYRVLASRRPAELEA